MNKLQLKFSGLCGFVPNTSGKRMRVLLVDARGAHPSHGAHQHEHHESVLLVPNAYVVVAPNLRQPERIEVIQGIQTAIFLLADQELKITNAHDNKLNIKTAGTLGECPNEDNWFSFEWVGSVGAISAGSGPVRSECVTGADPAVVSRILLTEGDVSTSAFARNQGRIAKWRFDLVGGGNPASQRQALAEEVLLDFDFSSSRIDLETSYFRNGSTTKTIRLDAPGSGSLEVKVLNMPWPDILRTRFFDPSVPRQNDFHFEHFYAMANAPGPRRIPIPVPVADDHCGSDFPSLGTPQCPPSRSDPSGSA